MQYFAKICLVTCLCFTAGIGLRAQTSSPPTDSSPATIGVIQRVAVSSQPHSIAIEITLSAPFLPTGTRIENPDRLVFDFPGFKLQKENRKIPVNQGPVRTLRTALFQQDPPIARIVVDLNGPANFDIKSAGNKVVIDVPLAEAASGPADSILPAALVERKSNADEPSPSAPAPPSEPGIAAPTSLSRPTAYSLQAKAKLLKLPQLQSLEDKAQAGDPEAETLLALAFHGATLLKRDDEEALRLLHKAADQGFMPAQESLGIFSEMGIGMPQPAPAEALEWYTKAAKQGSLDAATNIALMYSDGIGIPKDPTQAVTWFRQAAEGGDPTAQYNLALIYGKGKGVPQDQKESMRWLTAAADHNLVPAILDLAAVCLHPPDQTPADPTRAVHYYEKAANLGSAPAEAMLGDIYANGALGKPDSLQAAKWYRKSAEQGLPQGQFRLGRMLAGNKRSRSDRISAYKWLTLAAVSVKESTPVLDDLRPSMSTDEIHEAERQVDAWRDAHQNR